MPPSANQLSGLSQILNHRICAFNNPVGILTWDVDQNYDSPKKSVSLSGFTRAEQPFCWASWPIHLHIFRSRNTKSETRQNLDINILKLSTRTRRETLCKKSIKIPDRSRFSFSHLPPMQVWCIDLRIAEKGKSSRFVCQRHSKRKEMIWCTFQVYHEWTCHGS